MEEKPRKRTRSRKAAEAADSLSKWQEPPPAEMHAPKQEASYSGVPETAPKFELPGDRGDALWTWASFVEMTGSVGVTRRRGARHPDFWREVFGRIFQARWLLRVHVEDEHSQMSAGAYRILTAAEHLLRAGNKGDAGAAEELSRWARTAPPGAGPDPLLYERNYVLSLLIQDCTTKLEAVDQRAARLPDPPASRTSRLEGRRAIANHIISRLPQLLPQELASLPLSYLDTSDEAVRRRDKRRQQALRKVKSTDDAKALIRKAAVALGVPRVRVDKSWFSFLAKRARRSERRP